MRQLYEPPNPPVLPTSSDRLASQNEGGVEGGAVRRRAVVEPHRRAGAAEDVGELAGGRVGGIEAGERRYVG